MMKQELKRLLVPKSVVWEGMSKRFSVLYHGRWLKNIDTSSSNGNLTANINRPPSSSNTSICDKFCCLSREDVIRFLIGCLGTLAPLPHSSISSLGVINPNYQSIEASLPAIEATKQPAGELSAVVVVEPTPVGQYMIIGEILASNLWKCDYLVPACTLNNLSAGQFVTGVEDNVTSSWRWSLPHFCVGSAKADNSVSNGSRSMRLKMVSSRSIGFSPTSAAVGMSRSMYRGRSAPLTCKMTSSLAAVMAQMLSHRATHAWVTEDESDDVLVGVVGYAEIFVAATKQPAAFISAKRSVETFVSEIQNCILCLISVDLSMKILNVYVFLASWWGFGGSNILPNSNK